MSCLACIPVIAIYLCVLSIDDLLHAVDLLGNEFILQLQKLLILRLIIFQNVGNGLSIFIEHPKGFVDLDGEGTFWRVYDI
jgi:hypothetical protein